MKPDERGFEEAIEDHLLTHGWLKSVPSQFDSAVALDTAELFAFIGATQITEWEDLLGRYGNDPDAAQQGFAKRLGSEIDARGTVDVLRHGVVDLGVTIKLSYFRPAHNLTPALLKLYEANRVSVTRQLAYEPGTIKTLDMALLVNGIPVATAELKNPLTNQSIEHAIEQYRTDRDPKNITLRRALVHFAVDPERVAMTTKLAGTSTRFLPFNLGNDGGQGNPPNPNGHRTAYLWERVWERDAWMDLLARFIHVERPQNGSAAARRAAETIIFPRYHQWDAVLALEADAKANGLGRNYLVQHSAGSGKSNTIAWTAHRLSNLHDASDEKVFDRVVVITDRVILDRQLQDTIYQFEHARGVVQKIDQHSQQLADALAGEQARIIITTLQKFPVVLDKIGALPNRSYAVIVDEAHSSQTGEAAKDLKLVLGGTDETELTAAEAEDSGFIVEAIDPVEEALAKAVGARGKQANLSFFAFTATPKARTLELFGTRGDDDKFHPFHLYSMRQAIEENFILDVLANYTTYKTYWRIEKHILDDPEYETARAKQAIARFVSLHPSNLAQKAEIIIEHFRAHTAAKIGGAAKAMVVTSSRLHAVRYKQAIDAYIHRKGYTDIKALVAFSGKVITDDGTWTESGMNTFPESRTAEEFNTPDYQVLVVAEKYQTGFDQPLLHTMYVDKVLTGLNAVQTLSRLNRILPPLKEDTFVLDFRNDADDIVRAFEPYYGQTVALPTDPNLLYDTHRRLGDFDVIHPDEVEPAVAVLLTMSTKTDHGRIYSLLDPAKDRFQALNEDDRLAFKDALDKFVRTYSFLSQVVSFGDTKLEQDYLYSRALASLLRGANTVERLDLGAEVELTHLRHQATYIGSLELIAETGELPSFPGGGVPSQRLPDMEALSQIIDTLNERFGLELTEADQLLFDQYERDWLSDPEVTDQARNNTIDNFKLVFDRNFLKTVIGRMDENDALFRRILDDPEFQEAIKDFYGTKVYRQARGDQDN